MAAINHTRHSCVAGQTKVEAKRGKTEDPPLFDDFHRFQSHTEGPIFAELVVSVVLLQFPVLTACLAARPAFNSHNKYTWSILLNSKNSA